MLTFALNFLFSYYLLMVDRFVKFNIQNTFDSRSDNKTERTNEKFIFKYFTLHETSKFRNNNSASHDETKNNYISDFAKKNKNNLFPFIPLKKKKVQKRESFV